MGKKEERRHNTVYQAIAWNVHGWTKPHERYGHGDWNKKHGWAAEDWNFAFDQALRGFLYGYGQGAPKPSRLAFFDGIFDVVFYTNHPERGAVIVAVYRQARFLDEADAETAFRRLEKAGIVRKRRDQLRAAFSDPKKGRREVATFDRDRPVRWKVRIEDVLILPKPMPFVPTSWHYRNTHYNGLQSLQDLMPGLRVSPDDLVNTGFTPVHSREGMLRERTHLARERCQSVVDEVKASRLHVCEACGFTFSSKYADPKADGYVEAHHTVPLKAADPTSGVVPEASQFVLLCADCHRVAHLTGRFDIASLRSILRA